jgi:hypothetical protein
VRTVSFNLRVRHGTRSSPENIRFWTVVALQNFWSHILPIPLSFKSTARASDAGPSGGHTEVTDPQSSLEGDEYIGRFKVEVNDIGIMDVTEALGTNA